MVYKFFSLFTVICRLKMMKQTLKTPGVCSVLGNTVILVVELGVALQKCHSAQSPALLCVDVENCFLCVFLSMY